MKNNIFKLKNFLFLFFVVFCIQYTELKIDVIKVSEIALLLLTPLLYLRKVNKWIFYFLFLFTLWFLLTIILNPFKDFYLLQQVSILKKSYLISLGRFLELISCVNLMALVYLFFENKTRLEINNYVKYIFNFCLLFLIINVIIYYLYINGIIKETRTVYWVDRLRAWFGEGGPFGLMLSFTYVLTFFYKSKYHLFIRIFIVYVIFFLARSKAGILLILFWYLILYYKRAYKILRELNIIVIIIGGFVISLIFIELASGYIYAIANVKKEMTERPTDINLVMGRIAGVFIFPEMIIDHPIFGIGLGNYPIMRNNPDYLGFIPKSPVGETDAHGFGGLVQLLVDGGLFIFGLFFFIIYKLYSKLKEKSNAMDTNFLIIFLFFFLMGVQIYFLYPWILMGIIIALSDKKVLDEE